MHIETSTRSGRCGTADKCFTTRQRGKAAGVKIEPGKAHISRGARTKKSVRAADVEAITPALVGDDIRKSVLAASVCVDRIVPGIDDEDITDFIVWVIAFVVSRPRPSRICGKVDPVAGRILVSIVSINRHVTNRD